MAEIKKASTASKALGWISVIASALALAGAALTVISAMMPKSNSASAAIQSEDAHRLLVFVIGLFLAFCGSGAGTLTGIISLCTMLGNNKEKKLWLPIIGIAVGIISFISVIFGIALLSENT